MAQLLILLTCDIQSDGLFTFSHGVADFALNYGIMVLSGDIEDYLRTEIDLLHNITQESNLLMAGGAKKLSSGVHLYLFFCIVYYFWFPIKSPCIVL